MRGQEVLFSGAHRTDSRAAGSTDDWSTPPAFYNYLDETFSFTLDPCASADNAKCSYFDVKDDGLAQDWGVNKCFVNFPYSQANAWAEKCLDAARKGATVVVLCAARTDTKWWQALAAPSAEIWFIKGRLSFISPTGKGQGATFPSTVIYLRPKLVRANGTPFVRFQDVPSEVRR